MPNDELSHEDRLELERRRLAEAVTESVEGVLRKRYTWLAIITSFVIGGGVATSIIGLTRGAQRQLIETDIRLESAKRSVALVDSLSETVKEKIDKLDRDLGGLSDGRMNTDTLLAATWSELLRLNARTDTIKGAIDLLLNERQLTEASLSIEAAASDKIRGTLGRVELARYTVFVHYGTPEDTTVIKELTGFLRSQGFVVPGMQRVGEQVKQIRYFHDEDLAGAERLEQQVLDFASERGIPLGGLELKNLGSFYPNVSRGQIELWL